MPGIAAEKTRLKPNLFFYYLARHRSLNDVCKWFYYVANDNEGRGTVFFECCDP
ncbi:hypothetical protein COCCADRAFT_10620 [Bipolaris zeicola 26-R-13]|uniref:Uncharacterized protein n=1 Tax=Cochliobolus carbonum (strain 26-R-13) TaxID=930089 RepID=W6XV09_COCC2|nr:uncharacterized protein COCCADRAFT_10620 [Bipolaris zeicola 26-R-13]EUC26614.1 hypothetical protein COCCADRAFT_10620 [Bipolaris zeicola 26-R-13]